VEGEMHLYLAEKIRALGCGKEYFFRLAYMWRFKKEGNVSQDVLEYKHCGIIPVYVQEYVCHIQKSDTRK
jgi:hypothetical protein